MFCTFQIIYNLAKKYEERTLRVQLRGHLNDVDGEIKMYIFFFLVIQRYVH